MGKSIEKKILTVLLLLVFCLLLVVPAQAEEELILASQAAILMDADTGQILYEKNAHQQLYPASITKIMTAMLALQELEPGQVLTVSPSAVGAVPVTSSHISLKAGEQLTVEQALYAIATMSANDAANVLAEAVSGSLSDFAIRMTDTARNLGAMDTNFTNANGLPDSSHYTTAYDMALITAAALKVPGLAEYFRTTEYLLSPTNLSDARVFTNKDRLLPGGQYYYEGVLMAKTGWTSSAQGTFAAVVRRGDTTLIVIALKSPLLEDKYRDTWTLMDYGFSRYAKAFFTGEELAAHFSLGKYKAVAGQEFAWQLPAEADPAELTFSLGGETQLLENRQRVVTVQASIGDSVLPQWQLVLEKPLLARDVIPELSSDPGQEEQPEAAPEPATADRSALLVAVPVCVVLLLLAMVRIRKIRRRRLRRSRLQARIRHMKRQIGNS